MPYFSGIHVHVENIRGHKFDEWGVQSLPRQNKISAYITSKSEEIFQIVIKPDLLRPRKFLANAIFSMFESVTGLLNLQLNSMC